jgi:cellulose synthase operon protein C
MTPRSGWARASLAALVAAITLGLSPDADAGLGVVHPDLQKAEAAVRAAKGPEVYAALRDLWRTWDRADPNQVEEAITSIAESRAASPTTRVYASLLAAYSRRRRGDLDGAAARIDKLGFVGRWITIGPFDNENKAGFTTVYAPETELRGPIDVTRPYDGKERAVRWRVPPLSSSYGWVDLGEIMRPRENVCAYATTFIRAKQGTRAPRKVTLWLGAAGAFRLFWNGEIVMEDAGYRDLDVDRFGAAVTLGPGDNRVTVKVCGTDEPPKIVMRVGDERGAPDLGIDVIADPMLASKAIDAPKKTDAKKAPAKGAAKAPVAKLGPMAELEKMVSGKKPPASALEAFARYLASTGGDSKTEHRARDLARRAAEAEPTVKRLLLAGQLAEDRNQRREWVDKAAAIAGSKDVDVLLSQAHLARTGANWRDAVPIFEKILAIDPDHVGATMGLVELYIEAGLKRTALATLERATLRQPKSVSLLRVYAAELRAVGRDTEAAEVEAR